MITSAAHYVTTLALILLFCAGCSRTIETPSRFTTEFVSTLQKADPNVKVTIVRDLELKILLPKQKEPFSSFLVNAYDAYKQDPKSKADVIARYVKANLEAFNEAHEPVDRTRIVPIIKDRSWLSEVIQSLADRGGKKPLDLVYEDLNADLLIFYAQDSAEKMRFLNSKDLDEANIKRDELRELSCTNLKRLIPKIQCAGTNGIYMLGLGGGYDASILLFDKIWTNMATKVQGDIVVAVPSRDFVLVTGTKVPHGTEHVAAIAEKASGESPYRISNKLFVRQNGKFTELK